MFLGLDLGTTNVKAVVVERDGKVVAEASQPVEIIYSADGAAEQDIEDIWSATISVMKRAADLCDGTNIAAIGVSSQGGALQIQTADGAPVGKVISWLDSRGNRYDRELTDELGREWFCQHTGHERSALTIGQLIRLRQSRTLPKAFRVGFVGDVIVSRLCGHRAHDATSLSLGMLYNPYIDDADSDLLKRLGLAKQDLPDMIVPTCSAGGLLEEVASATAITPHIAVSPAIHDQYAAALACGAISDGDVMIGSGTAWVLLAVMDRLTRPLAEGAFVCRHPVEGLYGQILSMGNGGSAVSWARKTLGLDESDVGIDELVSTVPPGSEGLQCVPLFTGPAASASIEGLRLSHTPKHILRAVLEGLGCQLATVLDSLRRGGASPKTLTLTGRAASSAVTPQIIADITALPVRCSTARESSALGAAMIASTIAGAPGSLLGVANSMAPDCKTVLPGEHRAAYRDLYDSYRRRQS